MVSLSSVTLFVVDSYPLDGDGLLAHHHPFRVQGDLVLVLADGGPLAASSWRRDRLTVRRTSSCVTGTVSVCCSVTTYLCSRAWRLVRLGADVKMLLGTDHRVISGRPGGVPVLDAVTAGQVFAGVARGPLALVLGGAAEVPVVVGVQGLVLGVLDVAVGLDAGGVG